MCNSLANGGRRCAAHIKTEMANHEDNYNWEVLKAASEDKKTFPSDPIEAHEERKIVLESLKTGEVREANNTVHEASVALNSERNKYSFILSTRDENQVARYLYENSEIQQVLTDDLAKTHHAHFDRLKEIDDDSTLSEDEKDLQKKEAVDKYRFIREAIKAKSNHERSRALAAAPHALKAYKAGDASSLRMISGPMQGQFPHNIATAEKLLNEAKMEAEKTKKNAKNRALREGDQSRLVKSPDFSDYKVKVFPETLRGKKYFEKKTKLEHEYMLTDTYVKHIDRLIDNAQGDPVKVADLEQHRTRIERIRSLDSMARRNFEARLYAGS